jgi:predicted secreted acid phosphatase
MSNQFPPLPYQNNLDAVTFYQTSAEQFALCVQTYRFARMVLDSRVKSGLYTNPCLVMDLDETVLDNSEYNAWLIATGRNFHEPTHWKAWCQLGRSLPIPGAVGFIRYACETLGLPVFYVTSRMDADCRKETWQNLCKVGVPLREDECNPGDLSKCRLFMKGMGERACPGGMGKVQLDSKFQQRTYLETMCGFNIVLSVGDNLGDYADCYGPCEVKGGKTVHSTWQRRKFCAEQDRAAWGTDFILIPNSVYGGWLRCLYENGIGDESERSYVVEPVRGMPGPSQMSRMQQLRDDFAEWKESAGAAMRK